MKKIPKAERTFVYKIRERVRKHKLLTAICRFRAKILRQPGGPNDRKTNTTTDPTAGN